jgi:hypothetical protein
MVPTAQPFDRRTVVIATSAAIVLFVVTIAFAAATPLRFAVFSSELDLVSHTVGTLVCAAVAALSLARFRQDGGVEGLLQASAFVVLAVANFANTLVVTLPWIQSSNFRVNPDGGRCPFRTLVLYFAGVSLS